MIGKNNVLASSHWTRFLAVGARFSLGGARLSPVGARLSLGGARLSPAGARLSPGDARLWPGGARLSLSGARLYRLVLDFRSVGRDFRPAVPDFAKSASVEMGRGPFHSLLIYVVGIGEPIPFPVYGATGIGATTNVVLRSNPLPLSRG